MSMEKGFKYRIYPKDSQVEQLKLMFDSKIYVWNYFLRINKHRLKRNKKILSYGQMCRLLTLLKRKSVWLNQSEKSILQNTLKFQYQTFLKYFKKECNFPKYKTYSKSYESIKISYCNNNIEVLEKDIEYTSTGKFKKQNCKIKLPKIKKVKIAYSRQYQGRILSCVVSRDTDEKYYVSLCCTDVLCQNKESTNKNIGIDLGTKDFATTSDNRVVSNPNFYRSHESNIIKTQRRLSKMKKDGANWSKQRLKLCKIHKKIKNSRLDFLHKLTTELVKDYDVLCLEDLSIKKMMKVNSQRAKSIQDVSWYEFGRQLEYKANWCGAKVVKVDKYYPSSQLCSGCGNKSGQTKDLSVRIYKCEECGLSIDRDLNASINILNEGLRTLNK